VILDHIIVSDISQTCRLAVVCFLLLYRIVGPLNDVVVSTGSDVVARRCIGG
jgi:hypothetical protein